MERIRERNGRYTYKEQYADISLPATLKEAQEAEKKK